MHAQVFDNRGSIWKDFGSYGNSEGEFDCLAGVAVNRIGQYIIADRYNHRIQVILATVAAVRRMNGTALLFIYRAFCSETNRCWTRLGGF